MPKSTHHNINFTGGEVTPKVDARVDSQKYSSALRKCLNVLPYKTGGLTRSVGTEYMGTVKYTVNDDTHEYVTNVIPFIFSPDTTFVLELGNLYVRFWSNGQQVVLNSAPTWVAYSTSGILTLPGTFVEDSADANNIYYYAGTFGAAGIVSNTAPHLDPTNWVKQSIYEQPMPYTANAFFNASNVWDTPVFQVNYCQINDVMYFTHPDYAVVSLTRLSDTNWKGQYVVFNSPALLDQNITNTTIAASAVSGSVTLTASAPAWVTSTYYQVGNSVLQSSVIYNCVVNHTSGTFSTDFKAGYWEVSTIFTSGNLKSYWQMAYLRSSAYIQVTGTAAAGFSNGSSSTIKCLGSWEVHTYGTWSADIAIESSTDNGQTWDTVRKVTGRSDRNIDIQGTAAITQLYRITISNNSAPVNPGATDPRVVFEAVDSFLYGLVQITAVATAYSATATVINQLNDTSGTKYWSEGAWSTRRGFPVCCTSFQQRMIYANTSYQPQRIWGSVTNDIENFALGDQTLATDSFAFDLNAPSRGPIQRMVAQTDLFAFFSGAEWVINSGSTSSVDSSGSAITPTNINAVEHSSWGSAHSVNPAVIGNAVFFPQRQSTTLRQMLFSIYTTKYMSQDITALSEHLFTPSVAQIAYQTRWRNQSLIWALLQDGSMASMTYELDAEIFGWAHRRTGYNQIDNAGNAVTNDTGFEAVCVIPGKGRDDDEVWVIVNRFINNGDIVRYMERINPNNWEETFQTYSSPPAPVAADAFYVDCGKTYSNPGTLTLTGLDHLDGRYVVGIADGSAFPATLVSGGAITLPSSIPTTVTTVQVGLQIYYEAQPMRIDDGGQTGNTQSLTKSLSGVYARVLNASGGSIWNGLDYATVPNNQPVPIPYVTTTGNPFGVPTLITTPTDIRVTPKLMNTPGYDPVFILTGRDGLPITLLALIVHYDLTGTP